MADEETEEEDYEDEIGEESMVDEGFYTDVNSFLGKPPPSIKTVAVRGGRKGGSFGKVKHTPKP